MRSECALAERLESELTKFEPKGQDWTAKTCERLSEAKENSNWLNLNSKVINYNIFRSILS